MKIYKIGHCDKQFDYLNNIFVHRPTMRLVSKFLFNKKSMFFLSLHSRHVLPSL